MGHGVGVCRAIGSKIDFDKAARSVPQFFVKFFAGSDQSLLVLRPADEWETDAFLRVELTLRRTRPRLGPRGLESLAVPDGAIERGWLGRLRVRFEGGAGDFDPENRPESRDLSDEEESLWTNIQNVMETAAPRADPQWNLISMRIGPRVLSRLVSGTVVTFIPNGVADSVSRAGVQTRPKPPLGSRAAAPTNARLFGVVEAFLQDVVASVSGPGVQARSRPSAREPSRRRRPVSSPESTPLQQIDNIWGPAAGTNGGPKTQAPVRARSVGASLPMFRGQKYPRGKWHKCPVCHAPVVKGRFNPRVPFTQFRAGRGSIRDLRGSFLSRLRETYLVLEPGSVLESPASGEDDTTRLDELEEALSEEASAPNRPVERGAPAEGPDVQAQDD
jgi:hypothetical protein